MTQKRELHITFSYPKAPTSTLFSMMLLKVSSMMLTKAPCSRSSHAQSVHDPGLQPPHHRWWCSLKLYVLGLHHLPKGLASKSLITWLERPYLKVFNQHNLASSHELHMQSVKVMQTFCTYMNINHIGDKPNLHPLSNTLQHPKSNMIKSNRLWALLRTINLKTTWEHHSTNM